MILLAGAPSDPNIARLGERLHSLRWPSLLIEENRFPGDFHASWSVGGAAGMEGFIEGPGGKVDLRSITGIYFRRPTRAAHTRAQPEPAATQPDSLPALLDAMPCTVVNRPAAVAANASALYQRILASAAGFRTPRTLITSSPEEALAFCRSCRAGSNPPDSSFIRRSPVQFEERVEGARIRVFVVATRAFAWQHVPDFGDVTPAGQSIELPERIAAACADLANNAGLAVARVHLSRTASGEYYCLGIHAAPNLPVGDPALSRAAGDAVVCLLRASHLHEPPGVYPYLSKF